MKKKVGGEQKAPAAVNGHGNVSEDELNDYKRLDDVSTIGKLSERCYSLIASDQAFCTCSEL